MQKKTAAKLLAILAIFARIWTTTGSAHAGTRAIDTCTHTPADVRLMAATGCFKAYGDEVRACDTRADGAGAWVGLYLDRTSSPDLLLTSVFAGGEGNCKTTSKNITEGSQVYVKVCLRKDGRNGVCRNSRLGEA
ncbi:hypothetical protein [Streptomyces sp. NPDC059909]|uniref:hypothetical protein n=1 Tax=Streptomyces sp. NPDC059909 TaxID=3346998 RepID=UPI0036694A5E